MTVVTRETHGPFEDGEQTKITATSLLSVDELEEWYAENGELTLDFIDQNVRGEAGSVEVKMLPLSFPIELKQIRETYDPAELQELADRMPSEIRDGKPVFDLENAPTLNVMDREHCEVYFEKMYKYHRGAIDPIDIDSLPVGPDGLYYVTVNGHRRIRALKLKCLEYGMAAENLDVSFKLVYNLPFTKAKTKQYTENTYVRPTPVEDAHAIELHYLFLRDEGEDHSVAALEKAFGYKEDKIRDALRFVTAPEIIQEFVGKGLTYTNVVDLVRLREAYAESLKLQITQQYHADRELNAHASEVEKEQLMNDYLEALAGISDTSEKRLVDYFETQILNRLQGRSTADVGGKIRAQTKLVRGQYGYTTDTLFIFEEDAERRSKRVRVRKEMGGAAVQVLGYLDAQGDALSPEQLAVLQRIIDKQQEANRLSVVPDEDEGTGLFEEIA